MRNHQDKARRAEDARRLGLAATRAATPSAPPEPPAPSADESAPAPPAAVVVPADQPERKARRKTAAGD
ncbi:hypothetical protein [Zhihengliuella halotolerans]|uniref:Uncharacterized protein n=1 Tax=Zhihengliuella halotolerans TaxID=370736 RepID=A0A4Q8AC35_9MICC|nr:hypothetical protein [Zhihengliuella halotolerans]RZU61742.1 hypothetical protein EV380_1320 [Zhihengliuella halotolerans]